MSVSSGLSGRYAKAIYELAEEKKILTKTVDDFIRLKKLLEEYESEISKINKRYKKRSCGLFSCTRRPRRGGYKQGRKKKNKTQRRMKKRLKTKRRMTKRQTKRRLTKRQTKRRTSR